MQNSLWRQPGNRRRPLTSAVIALKISNFSYFFKPLQISETEKIGKCYLCVLQSFTLAEKKIGVRCTLIGTASSPVLFVHESRSNPPPPPPGLPFLQSLTFTIHQPILSISQESTKPHSTARVNVIFSFTLNPQRSLFLISVLMYWRKKCQVPAT